VRRIEIYELIEVRWAWIGKLLLLVYNWMLILYHICTEFRFCTESLSLSLSKFTLLNSQFTVTMSYQWSHVSHRFTLVADWTNRGSWLWETENSHVHMDRLWCMEWLSRAHCLASLATWLNCSRFFTVGLYKDKGHRPILVQTINELRQRDVTTVVTDDTVHVIQGKNIEL
jgi:hypothetical protein